MVPRNSWKRLKFLLLLALTKPLYYVFFLYSKTLSFEVENLQLILSQARNHEPIILPIWHQRLFCGLYLPKKYNLTGIPIMISRSKDGEFISRIVRKAGFLPIRGSSSQGGSRALLEMVREVTRRRIAVHVADGPTGPPEIVKDGLITMAQQTGARLCPIHAVYDKYWTFNSWDRFMVPKPFSRVRIRFDDRMLHVPSHLNDVDFELLRTEIESRMAWRRAPLDTAL